MNERIRLLWEEAAKTTQGDSWEEQTKFLEKFAELIVRECANLPFKATGEVTTIGEIAVSNLILKHFGVEE